MTTSTGRPPSDTDARCAFMDLSLFHLAPYICASLSSTHTHTERERERESERERGRKGRGGGGKRERERCLVYSRS